MKIKRIRHMVLLAMLLFSGMASAQVLVKGNVYGGGELGTVTVDTKVTINTNSTTEGSVFGGGKGDTLVATAGAVHGNTLVEMKGGNVKCSIYGGGELGSVGTFTAFETIIAQDTAGNDVEVRVPKTCASGTGVANVKITGGRVGNDQPYMPTTTDPGNDEDGYVFCGGKGIVDSVSYPQAIALAVVDSTYFEINGENVVVTASVYGGCENGLVLRNTYVKIANGQIGLGHYLEGTTHRWDDPYPDSLWANATTYVHDKNAAQINRIAGKFHECDAFAYDSTNYSVYDIYADTTWYNSNGGATVAKSGHSFFGNVFGGGSGYYPYAPGKWRRSAGRVIGNTEVDITGGHILTCVYGGNEITDVVGKATVNMSGGTVGVPRTKENIRRNPVSCMIFGAGMGDPRTAFNTWTKTGGVEINITGGTIFGSIYGGGEDGHVKGDVVVNIDTTATTKPLIGVWGNSNYDGNIFGGGRGFWGHALTAGVVAGNVEVNINGGDVLGTVYGGGRLASVGTHLVDVTNADYGKFIEDNNGHTYGYITVNVMGGSIGHKVFGGSMGRLTELNGTTENTLWPRLAMAKHTKVNVTGGTIAENVYGGSEFGCVRDSAIVVVDSIPNVVAPIIQGSVYGGGFGSRDYTSHANDSTAYPALLAGRVQGHTLVEVKNGTIKHNVYGGGELASVGVVKNNTLIKGITNVVVTGGTIGLDTIDHNANSSPYYGTWGWNNNWTPVGGNVFGGSKGVDNDPDENFKAFCNVNYTHVTIGAGKVWGAVYGGSADGHVLGNDSVFITTGAKIGTEGTSTFDGNVFGGGKGNYTNYSAGRVGGNTCITMDDGQVLASIYGGGRLSLVGTDENGLMQDGTGHGNTKIRVRGGIVGNEKVVELYSASSMGSVYGGGKGDIAGVNNHPAASALLLGLVKNTEVEISDTLNHHTHVYGIVFGGGEVANVGKYTWEANATYGVQHIQLTEGLAKVNISGGIIGGDRAKMRYEAGDAPYNMYPKYNDDLGYVYGGGEGISGNPKYYALVLEGTDPTTDTTRLVNLVATVNNTEVTISGGFVKGSVFGGAEAGHVRGNTLVTISGGQIGAGDNGLQDLQYQETDFVNPLDGIASSLYGTTHWPFGDTIITNPGTANADTTVYYHPYDPVSVMNGTKPYDGKSWFGNVFGGGSGWFPYIDTVFSAPNAIDTVRSRWNPLCGKVWGNTHVVVEGGHILNNVYGGNEATDIGGNATVDIKGGTVGVPRITDSIKAQPCSGYVFGGGCGDPRTIFDTLNLVNNTYVTVSGGIIYGSVLGGAEDGHVLGSTNVTVNENDGTTVIGCTGLSTSDGNIFGGGRNYLGENICAGRVEGNINVTMTSGTILGSIFGGGRLALSGINREGEFPTSNWDPTKHGNVFINVSGDATIGTSGDTIYSTVIGNSDGRSLLCGSDESVGDIFGSGKGDTKNYENVQAGCVTNTTINITGSPRIYGGVFGGGEMASIGYLTGDNLQTSDFITGTGESVVNVGSTTASESQYLVIGTYLEYDTAYMKHDPSEWTIYDSINGAIRVVHTCAGNVYGGSQGDVDPTSPDWIVMARSNKASVTINSGNILSSVFGGPEQGTMKGNATVTINGGTIGQTGLIASDSTTYSFGGVYGGGYGSDNTVEHHNALANDPSANGPLAVAIAGRVYGTATVTVNGGTIRENVFGGGEMATVDGNTTVNFYNGTVGPIDRLDSDSLCLAGNVYGGGKGIPLETYKKYCNVNDAIVVIGDNTAGHKARIHGDVYGGGADCHVLGDASVTILGENTLIGTRGVTNFDGNVFGGGRGSGYYEITNPGTSNADTTFILNPTCGRVAGNITVAMSNGSTKSSIFGGGRLALAGIDENGTFPTSNWDPTKHGNVTINVSGGTIGTSHADSLLKCDYSVGDIFGSGKGDIDNYEAVLAGCVTNSTINITGSPTIYGAVFGGGEMAGIGYRDTDKKFIDGTGAAAITIGEVNSGGKPTASNPVIGTEAEFTYYTDPAISNGTNPNPGQWTIYGDDHKILHTCTGNVFGGSQGDVDTTATKWVTMASSKSATVTINSGTIRGSVFGGSEQGTVLGTTAVTVKGGTIGSHITTGSGASAPYYLGDVYGGGYGSDSEADDNCTTIVNDSTCSALDLAGRVYGGTQVDILGGTVSGSVFGGGSFASVGSRQGSTSGGTTINMGSTAQSNYVVNGNIYGANNNKGTVSGDVMVNVNAGTIGTNTTRSDVFGGGYGEPTGTKGNVTVNFGGDITESTAASTNPTLWGDLYGGSAYGTVNDEDTDKITVNVRNGVIKRNTYNSVTYGGDVYGGGLGVTGDDNKGKVNGEVTVNVGRFENKKNPITNNDTTIYYGKATIGHNVYGANNSGGSPQSDVTVNIYGTAHTAKDSVDYAGNDATFAIDQVFGGGNYADYKPMSGGQINMDKTTYVNIFGCDNTIRRVFGGADAANTTNVSTDIQGGRFAEVFGGGNGEEYSTTHPEYAADILGNVSLAIHGGEVSLFFVGSNQNGTIAGTSTVTVDQSGPCGSSMNIDEFFCGGNYANVVGDVNATISCAQGMTVRNLYGGCNRAKIVKKDDGTGGNVFLTVNGGTFQNIYGGSKGYIDTDDPSNNFSADIEGDIQLTIQGGTIDTIFGGCNILGNVEGKITVTVIDTINDCDLNIYNIYGSGRNAAYTPTDNTITKASPEVNIIHGTVIKEARTVNGQTVYTGNVFGGGYGSDAIVTSSPKVTIGYNASTASTTIQNLVPSWLTTSPNKPTATVEGNVYGGGHGAKVIGNPHVILDGTSKVDVNGNVYGGGCEAEVQGNPKVEVK